MRVKRTHKYTHSQLTLKLCAISQLSAYSILHPKSHYKVSTIASVFVLQGRKKQSRPQLKINIRSEIYIQHSLIMNSMVSTRQRHATIIVGAESSSNKTELCRQSTIVSTLTSVMNDNTKVCVGGFVLWNFGGHRDDGRLGRILVGGSTLF